MVKISTAKSQSQKAQKVTLNLTYTVETNTDALIDWSDDQKRLLSDKEILEKLQKQSKNVGYYSDDAEGLVSYLWDGNFFDATLDNVNLELDIVTDYNGIRESGIVRASKAIDEAKKSKEKRCGCGDIARYQNGSCGESGCYNVPA